MTHFSHNTVINSYEKLVPITARVESGPVLPFNDVITFIHTVVSNICELFLRKNNHSNIWDAYNKVMDSSMWGSTVIQCVVKVVKTVINSACLVTVHILTIHDVINVFFYATLNTIYWLIFLKPWLAVYFGDTKIYYLSQMWCSFQWRSFFFCGNLWLKISSRSVSVSHNFFLDYAFF